MANNRERQGRLALAPFARLVLDVPSAGRLQSGDQAVGDDAALPQVGLAAALEPWARLGDECYVAPYLAVFNASTTGRP